MSYTFILAAGTFADTAIEEEHLAGQPVTVRLASLATPEEVEQATADADGIIVTTNPVPAESMARLGSRVRIIARAGIGLDAIDLAVAERRGIAVFHTPDYATEEVATHALALILALNRRIVPGDQVARRSWKEWRLLAPIRPLGEQAAGRTDGRGHWVRPHRARGDRPAAVAGRRDPRVRSLRHDSAAGGGACRGG